MSNYATDISQNYILNRYVYLHHSETPRTSAERSPAPLAAPVQKAILHFTASPCENVNWQSSKAGPLGAGAGKCKLALFIPEHM